MADESDVGPVEESTLPAVVDPATLPALARAPEVLKWQTLSMWASGTCRSDEEVAERCGVTIDQINEWREASDPSDWYAFADEVSARLRAVALESAADAAQSSRALPKDDETAERALRAIQMKSLSNLALASSPESLDEILTLHEKARMARDTLRKRSRAS